MLLALAAAETTDEPLPEAVVALQQATQATRTRRHHRRCGRVVLRQSPDGSLIAVDRRRCAGLRAHRCRRWRGRRKVTTDHQPGAGALSFAPSGQARIAMWPTSGRARCRTRPRRTSPRRARRRSRRPAVRGARRTVDDIALRACRARISTRSTTRRDAGWRPCTSHPSEEWDVVVWDVDSDGRPLRSARQGRSLPPGDRLGPRPRHRKGRGSDRRRRRDGRRDQGDRDARRRRVLVHRRRRRRRAGRIVVVRRTQGRRARSRPTASCMATLEVPSPLDPVFSPDGQSLAVGGNDNLDSALRDRRRSPRRNGSPASPSVPNGHEFSPDGSAWRPPPRRPGPGPGTLSPEGPPALGNFRVTGGFPGTVKRRRRRVGGAGGASYTGTRSTPSAWTSPPARARFSSTIFAPTTWSAWRSRRTSPRLATLDADYIGHVVDLATGQTTDLDRCESVSGVRPVRSARGDRRPDAVQRPSTAQHRRSQVPASPAGSSTSLPVERCSISATTSCTASSRSAFGPPVDGDLPGIVAVGLLGDGRRSPCTT